MSQIDSGKLQIEHSRQGFYCHSSLSSKSDWKQSTGESSQRAMCRLKNIWRHGATWSSI